MSTHIYLSPHLDDAAFSCGGLIHRQASAGERVVVVTVCAGDPPPGPLSGFAQALHGRWQVSAPEAVETRRAEDRVALRLLGATALHLDVPDGIYRADPETGQHLYASKGALFGQLHSADQPLVERLAAEIAAVLAQEAGARVYAPLGIGRHVDHQLTRNAAEALGQPLTYVEDYPYAAREPETAGWAGLAQGLTPDYVAFEEADLEAYGLSVAAYRSQISSFWPDEAALREALRRFAGRRAEGNWGLKLWRRR